MSKMRGLEIQISKMLAKATRSLEAARQLLNSDDYDFAASRAYYAVFYAMESILLSNNLSFSRHSSVIGAFNKNFVRPGHFPKEFSKWIAKLFRERQTGDYEFEFTITEEDARESLRVAETIVKEITARLRFDGFDVQ